MVSGALMSVTAAGNLAGKKRSLQRFSFSEAFLSFEKAVSKKIPPYRTMDLRDLLLLQRAE